MRKRLKRRYEAAVALISNLTFKPAYALRATFAEGYGRKDLVSDVLAGLVIGIVALPLSLALAIASGVPPQHGLYTAIVAGAVIALLGGSRVNVSGPTAAFVVILAPIAGKYGLGGLLVATMMAGVILVIMGAARLGRLIEFIPHPVTTGFTTGIAVVIATLQLKDFFGLTATFHSDHYVDRVQTLVSAVPTAHAPDITIGVATMAVLLLWPRITKKLPAPLVALVVGAGLAWAFDRWLGAGWHAATIGDRFSYLKDGVTHAGIPQLPPTPVLPWTLPGPGGKELVLSWDLFKSLAPSAFAIAVLGAIESLLCAVVADGMAGTKHDPDAELIAQGAGNVIAPFFGGIAATGAIARTATSIRAGARSPVAAVVHSLFVLAAVLALAPLVSYLPMASLAALLLLVAWNMSEVKHFGHMLRVAPKSDVIVLLACFSLTVIFDMVVSVSIGVVLAALLFMRRMSEISRTRLIEGEHPQLGEKLPKGVFLYEINGPFFYGATEKAISTLETVMSSNKRKAVILHMGAVPAMDVTGLVALESAIDKLHRGHAFVIISGVQEQPAQVLAKGGVVEEDGKLAICATLAEAVELAKTRRRPTAELVAQGLLPSEAQSSTADSVGGTMAK